MGKKVGPLDQHQKIEAFGMWWYRHIFKVPWTDKVRNNIRLKHKTKKNAEVMLNVKQSKLAYLGHVMRNSKYKILQNILQGKIEGEEAWTAQKFKIYESGTE